MARVGPTLSPVPLEFILPSLILMRLSQPACNFGHSSSAQLCLPATIMIVETTFDSGTIVGVEPLPGYRQRRSAAALNSRAQRTQVHYLIGLYLPPPLSAS